MEEKHAGKRTKEDMKGFIKSITEVFLPDSQNRLITLTTSAEPIRNLLIRYGEARYIERIVELLAKRYVEKHGDEILSRIQAQTIDSKVIAKVVSNLRAELREPKAGR